jgi:hypothetical protein
LDFYHAIGELPNFVLILSNFLGIICNFLNFLNLQTCVEDNSRNFKIKGENV